MHTDTRSPSVPERGLFVASNPLEKPVGNALGLPRGLAGVRFGDR